MYSVFQTLYHRLMGNIYISPLFLETSLVAQMVKHLPAMWETWFNPWVRKFSGEGNGNPPHYSCLKNPMDRGAWLGYSQSVGSQRVGQD